MICVRFWKRVLTAVADNIVLILVTQITWRWLIKFPMFSSDEPGKPGTPEIVDYDNKMVQLKWEKPEKDGGRPILHYVVEMKDKFSDWAEVSVTDDGWWWRGDYDPGYMSKKIRIF